MPTKSLDAASTATPTEAAQRFPTLMLAAGLSLGSAIALGLARFAYALLLPSMKLDLGWSFAQAGAMNTANALGYLLGALAFPRLARRWSARRVVRRGLRGHCAADGRQRSCWTTRIRYSCCA